MFNLLNGATVSLQDQLSKAMFQKDNSNDQKGMIFQFELVLFCSLHGLDLVPIKIPFIAVSLCEKLGI